MYVCRRIMEEKNILEQAVSLFIQFGIKSMTMDEIARQLGISKKTLYQHVENKNDLVKKAVEMKISAEQSCLCDIYKENGNAIDELMEMTEFVKSNMKEVHPSILFDMQKYHPEAWKLIEDHKKGFVFQCIKDNLEKGVDSGIYRDNLHPEIIAAFYLSMMNTIFEKASFQESKYEHGEIHEQMMRYHIRGIANEKGRAYLKEKFKNNNI